MKKKFELTLTERYASNWGVQEALRELFQNAIDQEIQVEGNTMDIRYEDNFNKLYISNKSSILSKKSLLLGYTSKSDDDNTIGMFGEGYKLALLVLNRLGKKVTIYNYGAKEIWTSKFVKSRRYEGEKILTIFVETEAVWKKVPNANLTIKIEGISKEEYEELVSRTLMLQEDLGETLKSSEYGTILLDETQQGKIYVNGLYVNTIKELTYGYNIKPNYLRIGRDRDLVSDFDIISTTSKMWEEHNTDELQNLIKNGCKDVSYLEHIFVNDEIKESTYQTFTKEYGENAIPVSSQSEYDMMNSHYDNANIVIVNSVQKSLITESDGFKETLENAVKKELSLEEEYLYWKERNSRYLWGNALEELEELLAKVIDMDKVRDIEEEFKFKGLA